MSRVEARSSDRPLIVDLDGTLVNTDLLHESTLKLFRERPLKALLLPLQLRSGKSQLKQYLAESTRLMPETLPYNEPFLHWLRSERDQGRSLILCTASNIIFAEKIAEFLGIFDEVIASDNHRNLKGKNKALALCERFGEGNFDYAGDSFADLPVWRCAEASILVNASNNLQRVATDDCNIIKVFEQPRLNLVEWSRAIRVQQWLKNLLLFAPVLAAHRFAETESLALLMLAFFSFFARSFICCFSLTLDW